MRSHLEAAIVATGGTLDELAAVTIDEALAWHRHSRLVARLLRLHYAELDHGQRLAYSKEIALGTTGRNKAIRALGLNRKINPWEAIDQGAQP